jgi:NAD(P)-dependent dehydrogenase (short-subunit alcohol dehydrogenase family)
MQSHTPNTAFITGGASGIGLALTTQLLARDWHVFVADLDTSGVQALASQYNTAATTKLHTARCDTTSWESQVDAFKSALGLLGGRISFVAPVAGIAERRWIPIDSDKSETAVEEFTKPDSSVMDVNLTGVLYTVALAVQHFRRQETGGIRGRIGIVASICGFYSIPSAPIYTATKHALVGLTRTYGILLTDEGIVLSAVAPNLVRTSIREPAYYDSLEQQGLLTPMEGVMSAFEAILDSEEGGLVYECGPRGGWTKREGVEYLDKESEVLCKMLDGPTRALQSARAQ